MHDMWKRLAPGSNEIHWHNARHAAKGNYLRKEVGNFQNALFRELERNYAIKFLQNGEMYSKQSLRKNIADFYLRLFQIGMTVLK